jgi:hypothetical protein
MFGRPTAPTGRRRGSHRARGGARSVIVITTFPASVKSEEHFQRFFDNTSDRF